MDLWRIGNHDSLAGEGGLKYAARWNSAGRPIVYLAESPAGAMLEVLIHLELDEDELPPSYMLLRVGVPDDLAIEDLIVPSGEPWKMDHGLSRRVGDEWLMRGEAALARVPSAILPKTSIYLLNPGHSEARRVEVLETAQARFDQRLLRHLRG
jgi:RES domain-containing protein